MYLIWGRKGTGPFFAVSQTCALHEFPMPYTALVPRPKLLYVCSRNQWRSRTAETIFGDDPCFDVKSAGTAASARLKVSAALIEWADVIFVMEARHREVLRQRFRTALKGVPLVVLDIEDEYGYMDEDLIRMLRTDLETYLASMSSQTPSE